MKTIEFICYKKCSTCAKAKKFLDDNKIAYKYREITENNPSFSELKDWIEISGLPIKRFFNTSGNIYRQEKLKDKLPLMTEDQAIERLSQDGMLVKRPLLILENQVLVGFKEEQYKEYLLT